MKRFLLFALLSLLALPTLAADRFFDLDLNAVWIDPNSDGTFTRTGTNDLGVDFKGDLGYGAAANIFFVNSVSPTAAPPRRSR